VLRLHLLGDVDVGSAVAWSCLGVHRGESVHPNKCCGGAEQTARQSSPDRAPVPPGADHWQLADDKPRDHDSPSVWDHPLFYRAGLIAALTFVKLTDFLPKLTAVDVTQNYWGLA
jgi:hypothetical protein